MTLRSLGGVLLALLLLTGCSLRLDTPPPEVPDPEPAEQVRQDAARTAAELHGLAQAARAGSSEDLVEVLLAVESASAEHHAALGGVWEPWPGAGPEATAHPGPEAAATPRPQDAEAGQVLTLLEEGAAAAHAGALTHAGELGSLLGSLAISRTSLAADLSAALDTQVQALPAEPLPAPEPGTVDPETSRRVDAARYAFEVLAARSSGDQRAAAAHRAERLAAVADAVDPEQDARDVAYDITGSAGAPAPDQALAAAAELDVLGAYVTLLSVDGGDRQAVLAAAAHAAGQVRAWDAPLPALPGLS